MSCPDDNTLGAFAEALLTGESHRELQAHLDVCTTCRRTVATLVSADMPEGAAAGSMLGRYRLITRLGAGSMGVVYAAHDPELDRKVAIKVLRSAQITDPEQLRTRLAREAKAMARLHHPNVITVHDIGTTGDHLFIAMELIEGVTLTRWLAAAPRTWRDVLAVFLAAGRGLAAAHEAGLVHRDFKPDNVLIGDDGRVCVTDFGLARLPGTESLSQRLDASFAATATRSGMLVGTPAYMAPEQLLRHPVDARADQFSFAVAFYEALYGRRPFEGDRLDELLDHIVAGQIAAPPAARAAPAWLHQLIIRGLAARRVDRHPSMHALIAALERDRARPRRLLLGGIAAVATVVGLTIAVRQLDRAPACDIGAERLAGAWNLGKRVAVRAALAATGRRNAADVASGVERALDGYAKQWLDMRIDACRATNVRHEQSAELLDLRDDCLDRRRQELGALTDLLAHADAQAFDHALGAVRGLSGIEQCANVAALRNQVPPIDAAQQAKVRAERDELARAKALLQLGHYPDGLPIAQRVVTAARELHYRPLEAEALYVEVQLNQTIGNPEDQERLYWETVYAAEAARDERTAARAWIELSDEAEYRGHYAEAERWSHQAAAAIERMGGDDRLTIVLYDTDAARLGRQGRHAEALELQRRAVALAERALGPDHDWVAECRDTLGTTLGALGYDEQAAEQHRRAVAIHEHVLGANHPATASSLVNLGDDLERLGKLDEALATHRRAVTAFEQSVGADNRGTAYALEATAKDLRDLHRLDEALAPGRRAVDICDRALKGDETCLRGMLPGLGWTLLERGELGEAQAVLERALHYAEIDPGDAADMARTQFLLARALWDGGGDRRRARRLAEGARDTIAVAARAEVETWLSSHVVQE